MTLERLIRGVNILHEIKQSKGVKKRFFVHHTTAKGFLFLIRKEKEIFDYSD